MKYLFAIILLTMLGIQSVAQQTPQYSLYMLNPFGFNPAYAGMDNTLSLTGAYRNQWVGIEGNPRNQHLNAHMPLYLVGGSVGVVFESESIGSWTQTTVKGAYSYALPMGQGVLSLGLGAGWLQRQLDGSKVRTPDTQIDDQGNPIDHQDPLLTIGKMRGSGWVIDAGAWFATDRFEMGVSVLNAAAGSADLGLVKYRARPSAHLFARYNYELSRQLTLQPSVLVKSIGVQTQADFSLAVRVREQFFVGASWRGYGTQTQDAIVAFAGLKLSERMHLGYSYDLTRSSLNTVSNGSHELLLRYQLDKPVGQGQPPPIIYNPRSL